MKHEVKVVAGGLKLERSTMEFQIEREGKRYGTLRIGTGSLVWVPYDRTYGYRVNWDQMNALAQQIGLRETPNRAVKTRAKTNGSVSAEAGGALIARPDWEPIRLIRVTDEGEDVITLRRMNNE